MTLRRLRLSHRLCLPSTRQFRSQCTPQRVQLHDGADTNGARPPSGHDPVLQPTPLQLLRFVLTGSPHSVGEKEGDNGLQRHLEELLDWEPTRDRPSVLRRHPTMSIQSQTTPYSKRSKRLPWSLSTAEQGNLHSLMRIFEANPTHEEASAWLRKRQYDELGAELLKCRSKHSYLEIFAFINGLEAKLLSVHAPIPPDFYAMALAFAAPALSAPALKHYLHRYRALCDTLDKETWRSLAESLNKALKSMKIESPQFDTSPLLHVLIGEGLHDSRRAVLHPMIRWVHSEIHVDVVGEYVKLLVNLRSRLCLDEMWHVLLDGISEEPSPAGYQTAYACIASLVATGQLDTAIACLESWSARHVKSLPGLSKSRDLHKLFANSRVAELLLDMAGREETQKLFDRHLLELERRLGVNWQPKTSSHVGLPDAVSSYSGQLDPSADDHIVGYTSVERLMAEIRALGCSRSAVDLGQLADLLHEHDGTRIPVEIQHAGHDSSIQLAWFPQCSPVEFAGALPTLRRDVSVQLLPASLGLIRARLDCDGQPALNGTAVHLMQLGSLGACPATQESQVENDQSSWTETGHLVVWDRVAGDLFIVFVGRGTGVVDTGLQAAVEPPYGLPRISRIAAPRNSDRSFTRDYSVLFDFPTARLHFDVDPAADIVPQ